MRYLVLVVGVKQNALWLKFTNQHPRYNFTLSDRILSGKVNFALPKLEEWIYTTIKSEFDFENFTTVHGGAF
jgi:hypothetical protein